MTSTEKKSWIGLIVAAVALVLLLTVPAVVSDIQRQNDVDRSTECYEKVLTGDEC